MRIDTLIETLTGKARELNPGVDFEDLGLKLQRGSWSDDVLSDEIHEYENERL